MISCYDFHQVNLVPKWLSTPGPSHRFNEGRVRLPRYPTSGTLAWKKGRAVRLQGPWNSRLRQPLSCDVNYGLARFFCAMVSSTKQRFLVTFLLCILLVVKTGTIFWLQRRAQSFEELKYSYLADDHPRAWPIPMSGPIHMPLENTVHYAIESSEADEEWRSMIPGNGIVYLGEHRRPFSISMFHQLRCMDILRQEMWSAQSTNVTKPDSLLNQHCLNYMRQMVLCASDTTLLEPISQSLVAPELVSCRNWSVVYEAVEENQRSVLAFQ
ncbi:hypothetical protein C8F01DRAFT_1170360 [Mycena amicta]|nr:hypothetical protein C8F01DRAFT_1170360 [Mycena amicta]